MNEDFRCYRRVEERAVTWVKRMEGDPLRRCHLRLEVRRADKSGNGEQS